jgi:hypothetical protein
LLGYQRGNTTRFITSSAMCAVLYAILNALTASIHTPWGIGEFRPGVVIPAFFAVVAGPLPAAVGGAVGSFLGDIALTGTGGTNLALALFAGAPANFVGFLVLGWIFQKIKTWKGFIIGTTSGLFIGNLIAAVGVVLLLGFPSILILGYLLFWVGTMFPFVVIFVPVLVRVMKPYASQLTAGDYTVITEPSRRVLWTWSILVSVLMLVAVTILVLTESGFIAATGGTAEAWIALFAGSAVAVLVVGAFIPGSAKKLTAVNPQTK